MSEPSENDDVSLEQLLEMHRDAVAEDLHTQIIGRVESYDHVEETADVVPMVRRALRAVDGSLVRREMPVLRAVRVMPMRFGNFFIYARLKPGDFVTLHCLERDHARFFQTGDVSDPLDLRMHHLAHAVATPYGYPGTRKLATLLKPDETLVIGHISGPLLKIESGGVVKIENATEIQAAGVEELAKYSPLDAHLAAISADLEAIAIAAGTAATNYGAAGKTALDISEPIATEKVKGS